MIDQTPYTPGVREVLKLAKVEAGRLGHNYVGPEHFLLGIMRKGDGIAAMIIQNKLNINVHYRSEELEKLKIDLEQKLEIGTPISELNITLTHNEEAKRVLESAKDIANEMKYGWIGTEHLLLALIKEEDTIASEYLKEKSFNYQDTKNEAIIINEGRSTTPIPEDEIIKIRKQANYFRTLYQEGIVKKRKPQAISENTKIPLEDVVKDLKTLNPYIGTDRGMFLYIINAFEGLTDEDFKKRPSH